LISLVLSLSWFLIYAGLELLGFMLSIIYLGAVLIFFIFVVMLIDLRFEDLQDVYEEAKMFEPQDLTILYPITIFLSMFFSNILLERILYEEYYGLEFLITTQDTTGLSLMNSDMLLNYFAENIVSPTSIGFSMFSTEGGSVGVLSLVLLFSLYISLYTVQTANEEVMLRLELTSLKNAAKKSSKMSF
jgi:uncharacterized SAM-binding protein YcdF (DUF218 family)